MLADRLAGGRRQRDAQDLLQLVDRAGRTRAARDDAAARSGVDGVLDGPLRLVQQPAHAAPGQVVLGVRVGVDALQVLQVALDEVQAAAGRRVVAIHHQPAAERGLERGVDADDLRAEEVEGPGRGHRRILPCCSSPLPPWRERSRRARVRVRVRVVGVRAPNQHIPGFPRSPGGLRWSGRNVVGSHGRTVMLHEHSSLPQVGAPDPELRNSPDRRRRRRGYGRRPAASPWRGRVLLQRCGIRARHLRGERLPGPALQLRCLDRFRVRGLAQSLAGFCPRGPL